MAHRHGGQFDPNTSEQNPSHGASAHGGSYTPGSQDVKHQTQPQVAPMQPTQQPRQADYVSQNPLQQNQPSMQYQPQPPTGQYTGPRPNQNSTYQQPAGNLQQDRTMDPSDDATKNTVSAVVTYLNPLAPASSSDDKEKEFPTLLKGSRHAAEVRSTWRWIYPHWYQKPGYIYNDSEVKYRHRDFAGRVGYRPRSDRYLHHNDGYLRNLYVSCTDEIYEATGTSTWKRTYVNKVAPMKVRLATWVADFSYDPESWNDWWIMVARALPATLAMTFVFWDGRPTVIKHSLDYAPVLYAFHGDAKVWSNMLENRKGLSLLARNNEIYRLLKPRHLCFLRSPFNDQNCGVNIRLVTDWEATDGQDIDLGYLFVAYSTEHFSHSSEADMMALHHIAETACRAAKLPAYWIACSCMRDQAELEADVYRISDVLRGAHSMIIAVGEPKTASSSTKANADLLLREWGSRMWTFPEVLLSPGTNVKVYNRGGDLRSPMIVAKNQFASRAWAYMDPDISRHLIDHYLGSITLSRLELAILALKCLYSRHTTQYMPGDQAYALMGLLRLRPQIDRTDSAFQAFSRLSLANDSDMLLERYICTLPVSPSQPWYSMEDAYQSQLWDISPYCQVAGVADDDTVIIDGARGISVRWKSFYPVYWSSGPSFKRWFASLLLEWNGLVFFLAVGVMAAGGGAGPARVGFVAIGVLFLLLFFYTWLMTPKLVRTIYGGKFAEVQAEMFGFEGHLNAATIERAIFGGNFGRFSWSTNGSPLSRSVMNEFGEKIGIDPCKDTEVRMKVETAKQARPGDMRVFTLVDTYNMQITLFEAVRPPVTLMFCASEGGMQRAIGCSYEWTNQTMYRETVLRLPSTALNRMNRIPRFRMGIQRPNYTSHPVTGSV